VTGLARIWGAWLALIAPLGIRTGLAYVPIGASGLWLSLPLGICQAGIVVFALMRFARAPRLARLFAIAGIYWLLILVGLSLTDYLARVISPGAGG
jgi:cytochrome c oxidase subunit 4